VLQRHPEQARRLKNTIMELSGSARPAVSKAADNVLTAIHGSSPGLPPGGGAGINTP